MTTVGIIYKQEDELIAGTAQQIKKDLLALGFKISLNKADFVITLGGDGTILRAARMLAKNKIPILGVHLGGLGFLSEIQLTELSSVLALIKKRKFAIDERAMIETRVGGRTLTALNDFVISHSGIARVIKVQIEGVANYLSDGIIFSTATGSTAYNLSAGGPILTPQSKSIIITPICSHSIATRPIVVEEPIVARLTRGREGILTADGQTKVFLKIGKQIKIQPSKLTTRLIRVNGYDFFSRVRESFAFGSRI